MVALLLLNGSWLRLVIRYIDTFSYLLLYIQSDYPWCRVVLVYTPITIYIINKKPTLEYILKNNHRTYDSGLILIGLMVLFLGQFTQIKLKSI